MASTLVSLADLKTWLGIPSGDTSTDTYLNNLITYSSYYIQNYCNRQFGQNTITEIYSGDGTICLVLNQRPVSPSGLTVYLDDNAYFGSAPGAFASDTLLQYGVDYALEIDGADGLSYCGILQGITVTWDAPFLGTPGRIYPLLGQNATSWGNIQVTYTYGISSVQEDIQLACFLLCSSLRNSKNQGAYLSSESFSDGAGSNNYSIANKPKVGIITPEVGSILAKYINVAVA